MAWNLWVVSYGKFSSLTVDPVPFLINLSLRVHRGEQYLECREKLGIDGLQLAQIHVSFISKKLNGFLVNEAILREVFNHFGKVADVTVKKHVINPQLQQQSGYGFVYYYAQEDACRAVLSLKHNSMADITFDCTISHKALAKPNKYQKRKQQHHQQQLTKKPNGSSSPTNYGMTGVGNIPLHLVSGNTLAPTGLGGLFSVSTPTSTDSGITSSGNSLEENFQSALTLPVSQGKTATPGHFPGFDDQMNLLNQMIMEDEEYHGHAIGFGEQALQDDTDTLSSSNLSNKGYEY